MPLYHIRCRDKPGHLEVRLDNRADHLAYLEGFGAAIKAAGPTLDEADKPNGSVIVIELANEGAARDFCAGDPYAKAGLFTEVEVAPMKGVIWNTPEGA
jgi:uncharacterized protein YciI